MTWIISIGVLALALGPILYLLPSAKDRYLSALRAAARERGFTIQLDQVPQLDPSVNQRVSAGGKVRDATLSCARYQLPLGVHLGNLPPLLVVRVPEAPALPIQMFLGGWGLVTPSRTELSALKAWQAKPELMTELTSTLALLPSDVVALRFEPRLLACFWHEDLASLSRGGSSQNTGHVSSQLDALHQVMTELILSLKAYWE